MSWRASVGRAFRPPNIYELYRTWRSSTGRIYQSNPNLSPETSLDWEIGTTLKPFQGNVITATYFENYADDLIYRVEDPSDPTGKTLSLQNAAKATIRGVELEVTQKLFTWLDVFGNLTLLDARINENPLDPWSVGKKLTFVPRQLYNFGINVNYWKINANLSGHYVSKIHTRSDNCDTFNNVPGSYDPYFTLDTKITITPVKWCNISFSVDNLLDRQYYYYYVTPGRTWWLQAGLKY
jgi:iron complex outermembrane receptor protein